MKEITKQHSRFSKVEKSQFNRLASVWEQEKGWKEKSQHIAIEILDYMDTHSYTQKDIAEKIGVSPQLINRWLKGNENFTLRTIDKLEKLLQTDLIQIVNQENITILVTESLPTIKSEYTVKRLFFNSEFIESGKVIPLRIQYKMTDLVC